MHIDFSVIFIGMQSTEALDDYHNLFLTFPPRVWFFPTFLAIYFLQQKGDTAVPILILLWMEE